MEELRVTVEPDSGDRLVTDVGLTQACFPLRRSKVQRPILSAETLPRDRLLNWLGARASKRVVYIVAEAGFGKTTLVADYLRRSHLRTFWYRLDEEETDGLVFLRYLVAACQAVDSGLLVRSASLLSETSFEPVGQEAVFETVIAEIGALGEVPSALVLDDFHAVESVPSVCAVVERLIDRLPAGVQVLVTSRRTPSLPVAALRAHGDLAELDRDELRFDEAETGRLFRDFYHHALEPDVLHGLQERTDGWAASLQLVKTAVEGRTAGQVRAFVESLSGAEGNLYDYLAEEVVGELQPEIRDFLVRSAILDDLEPETAAIACDVTPERARRLLGDAQHLGLVSRGGEQRGIWRTHPLVREFLLAHLEAELGEAGVAEMHRRVAAVMETTSWRLSVRHWAAAGDACEVRRVIATATPAIIGTGDIPAAGEFITAFPDPDPNPWFDIIRTRQFLGDGQLTAALDEARKLARYIDPNGPGDSRLAESAALAMLRVGMALEDSALRSAANNVLLLSRDAEISVIAQATDALYETSEAGRLDHVRSLLLETIRLTHERGHTRYRAIALLNLAFVLMAFGDAQGAVDTGTQAIEALGSHTEGGDFSAALMNTAKGMAHVGRWTEAQSLVTRATSGKHEGHEEVFAEAAELEAMYGDPARAFPYLNQVLSERQPRPGDPFCRYVAARVEVQSGNPERALELLSGIKGETLASAFRSSRLSLDLQIRATSRPTDPALTDDFETALRFAHNQQAWFSWKSICLTRALVAPSGLLSSYIMSLPAADSAYLSIQAELVVRRLSDLDAPAREVVHQEACRRPARWRWALRQVLSNEATEAKDVQRIAELLELVGDETDVVRLRSLRKKKVLRLPNAGQALCRRLAPRVYVEDLGRVSIRVGPDLVPGTEIRRKVLALLCFLLTRPQFSATREQVFEALWPEMDPVAGANSLNQSAYFLRHVLQPDTDDDDSAGYLRSRSDLIWLDQELVNCRSADCSKLIADIRSNRSPELVAQLAETYAGPYAIDFIYDDWATSFRETLHASYLDRVERAITADTKAGAFERALSMAQLALQADPEAEQIELCLLRLYRRMGANAAAAEQYVHYASAMRGQLGIEPPPLESI